MKQRILVTGGLGFIGSNLVDKLVEDDDNHVVVLDDASSESSSINNWNEKARYLLGDVRRISQHAERLSALNDGEKFDVIFHLAARARIQPSFDDPTECFDIDARGTCEMLEYARHNAGRFVYAGSSSAYGGPKLNPYAFSKYVGEQLCELYSSVYSVPTVIARFFNVYGPRQPTVGKYATVVGVFEHQMKNGLPLTVTGTGEQRRDFTHVDDIVDGFIALANGQSWSGEVFNLGTARNHSINELAALFGGQVKFVPARRGEAWTTLADVRHMQNATGWCAKRMLEDYVERWKITNLA